jgi:tartrate/fumarate subfamily iron-sulfur-dependent hydro-lyase beta chain
MSAAARTGGGILEGRPRYSAVLDNPRFRRLWASQFVSGIGDWLVIGLLIPLVTTLSGGSAFAVAGIMIAKILPALVLSSVVGVFVDRYDRRRLMIAADVTRALLALGLLFTDSLALIYLVVFLMEVASLVFMPAKNALIPHLVEPDDLTTANGLSYTTQQASMLIGLTMSGALLAAFEAVVRWVLQSGFPFVDLLVGPFAPALLGPRAGVIMNSLSFVFSAVVVSTIKVVSQPKREGTLSLSLIGKDAIDSFRFLGHHRQLRGLLVTIGLALLGGGAIVSVGVVYVQQNLTGGVPFLDQVEVLQSLIAAPQTFMLVFLALGMVIGALVVPRLATRIPLQLLFLGGVGAFGGSMLIFALASAYWTAVVFALVAGFCIACITVAGNTYVARVVADEARGRVFTALESVIRVALLISMVVVAPIGDLASRAVRAFALARGIAPSDITLTGSRLTLLLASVIVIAAAVYAYRTLDWRASAQHSGVTGRLPSVPFAAATLAAEDDPPAGIVPVRLPASTTELASLIVGQEVRLTGTVFTARDATHARIVEELERTGELPFGLAGQTLFYAGPTPATAERPVGAVGPTTARRMDAWTPRLLAAGITATIGKGHRSEAVRRACAEHDTIYFAAVGGAAALLATRVSAAETVAWEDLGTEALVRMEIDDFPAFVAIDSRGGDLYEIAPDAWHMEVGS